MYKSKQNQYIKLGDNSYLLLNTDDIIKMKDLTPDYDSSYYDSDENNTDNDSIISFEETIDNEYDKKMFIQELREIILQDYHNNSNKENTVMQINISKISFNIDYDDFEKLIFVVILNLINNNDKSFYDFIIPIIHEFIRNEIFLNELFKILNEE